MGSEMCIRDSIGTDLAIGGQLYSLYEGHKARKEAKKAQEEQKTAEAFNNLLRIVGGGMPGQTTPVQPVPQVPVASAIAGIGGALSSLGQSNAQKQNAAFERGIKERELALEKLRVLTDANYKKSLAGKAAKGNAPTRAEQLAALKARGDIKSMSWIEEQVWKSQNPGQPVPSSQNSALGMEYLNSVLHSAGLDINPANSTTGRDPLGLF